MEGIVDTVVPTSIPAFRRSLRPIMLLAVGLMIFTAVITGFLLHLSLPDVPLAACVALGAVVAPPDAVSATAIARRIGLPRRIVTLLAGESLLDDATALVMVRIAGGALVAQESRTRCWTTRCRAHSVRRGGRGRGIAHLERRGGGGDR